MRVRYPSTLRAIHSGLPLRRARQSRAAPYATEMRIPLHRGNRQLQSASTWGEHSLCADSEQDIGSRSEAVSAARGRIQLRFESVEVSCERIRSRRHGREGAHGMRECARGPAEQSREKGEGGKASEGPSLRKGQPSPTKSLRREVASGADSEM